MRTCVVLVAFIILMPAGLCKDDLHILHDNCINNLFELASNSINNPNIMIIRDSRGIIIRTAIENPVEEYDNLSTKTQNSLSEIQYFLAKIKNPAIIEVHAEKIQKRASKDLKNWEISTVIANNAESYLSKTGVKLGTDRIYSVGYGEFLPAKNTPYNGGNFSNRIDIIILCNIIGE